jgi:CubicO group peptidase (beta-lactamase class C family)
LVLLFQVAQAGLTDEPVSTRMERVEQRLIPNLAVTGQEMGSFPLQQRLRFYKVPGASIAVIHDGTIEWSRGYGVLKTGTATPVTPETPFQAASISKMVAAIVALRVVDLGKLDLDEDVNNKLMSWKLPENEFTKNEKVTLRRLPSHRAGLTDNAGFSSAKPSAPWPKLADVLEAGKWTPAPIRVGRQPGPTFQYSGGGYCLMELLLEDATGKPFPKLARELVFEPLQMTHSWFEQNLSAQRERVVAIGHLANGKPLPQRWNSYPATSAAGLWTTPTDLARLVIEIQSAYSGKETKVLSSALAREMLTIQGREDSGESIRIARQESYPDDWRLAWGLGVGLIGRPPVRFFHSGSNPGYQCELQAHIHGGKCAVVMTNADQGWQIARELLVAVAKEYEWPAFNYPQQRRMSAPVSRAVLSKIVGEYRLASNGVVKPTVRISTQDDQLYIEISDYLDPTPFYSESETVYFTTQLTMTLRFTKNDGGEFVTVTSDHGWSASRP